MIRLDDLAIVLINKYFLVLMKTCYKNGSFIILGKQKCNKISTEIEIGIDVMGVIGRKIEYVTNIVNDIKLIKMKFRAQYQVT